MKTLLNSKGLLLSCLVATALSTGCASERVGGKNDVTQVTDVSKIVLLAPTIECRESQSNNSCALDPEVNESLHTTLVSELRKGFAERKIKVDSLADYPRLPSQEDLYASDLLKVTRLLPSQQSAADQEQLLHFKELTAASHILSIRCRVYVGPGGFWNPMNGAIASDTSRMVIEASLFSVSDRRSVWTQISQARVSPRDGAGSVASVVTAMLKRVKFN